MKIKLTLTALVLTLLPGLAAAACSGYEKTTAMTCAEGMTMDPETQTCIPVTTG